MSEPTYLDHRALGIYFWTSIFKASATELHPRLEALHTAIFRQVQDLEDALWGLLYDRLLSTASGAALEQIGTLVGEERLGADDTEYRRFIAARIRTNRSGGEPDDLIWILATITEAVDVLLFPATPADVTLDYVRTTSLTADQQRRVGNHMVDSVGAGVSLNVVEAVVPYFGFLDTPGALGFGAGVLATCILSEE